MNEANRRFRSLATVVCVLMADKGGHDLKILLVYPSYPDTFWSFRHALKFISKKSSFPPLGLLTVAAMLPGENGSSGRSHETIGPSCHRDNDLWVMPMFQVFRHNSSRDTTVSFSQTRSFFSG